MNTNYLLKSERLGFRNWSQKDLPEFAAINADTEVMQYFPKSLTEKETFEYIQRLQNHYEKNGFNYFAVEILETGDLIGFTGLGLASSGFGILRKMNTPFNILSNTFKNE